MKKFFAILLLAALAASASAFCSDPDYDGQDMTAERYVKGQCTDNTPNSPYTDYCGTSEQGKEAIVEYQCSARAVSGNCLPMTHVCEYGCVDGACLKEPQPTHEAIPAETIEPSPSPTPTPSPVATASPSPAASLAASPGTTQPLEPDWLPVAAGAIVVIALVAWLATRGKKKKKK